MLHLSAMPAIDRRRALVGAALFGGFTLLGLFDFLYAYLDDAAHGLSGSAPKILIEELAGAYGGLLLLPLIWWATQRFRPGEGRWLEAGVGHLGACFAFSFAHTSWNGVSRSALFPIFGLGEYDYGRWAVRYWMELPNDIVGYVSTVAVISAVLIWRERSEANQPAAAQPRRLLVRSGRSAALLPLEKIDWVQAARNYAEIHSSGKVYLMRGGLSALEEKLDPDQFLRLNRSHLVRVEFIRNLRASDHGEFEVTLADGSKLSWTRRYRERARGLILEAL